MTVDEAIKYLKHELNCMLNEPPQGIDLVEEWEREHEKCIEAKKLAIKALECLKS